MPPSPTTPPRAARLLFIANRLLTVSGAAVTSDANGNVTAYGSDVYGWDVRGRLKSLTRPGYTFQFGYRQDGLRTSRTINGTTTTYLLNGDSVVTETTSGTSKQILQGPGVDQVLARDGKWLVPNHQGSTVALTDGSGNVTQSYGYKPFGELTNSPTDSNPFQFTGRENDGTGLMYYRARYYAPVWGRFLSEDPIGFEGGINQYAYCENNPINDSDPQGTTGSQGMPPWPWWPPVYHKERESQWFTWESFVAFGRDPFSGVRDWGSLLGTVLEGVFFGPDGGGGSGRRSGRRLGQQTPEQLQRSELLASLPAEVRRAANDAFERNHLLSKMSMADREMAARVYEQIAEITTGASSKAGRLYNLERAKFLRGQVDHIADSLPEFAKEYGISLKD